MSITAAPSLVLTEFCDLMRDQMKLCSYRPHTIKAYLGQVQGFLRFNRPLSLNRITEHDIRDYLNHLVEKGLSRSTIDQAVKAIEILYYEVLQKQLDLSGFKRPRKDRPAPILLTPDEVNKIATNTKNPTHQLMIELAYSTGLRVFELVEVRVENLNLKDLTLFIPGSDKSSRTTVFSEHLRDPLIRQIEGKNVNNYLN